MNLPDFYMMEFRRDFWHQKTKSTWAIVWR